MSFQPPPWPVLLACVRFSLLSCSNFEIRKVHNKDNECFLLIKLDVVHLITRQVTTAVEDLREVIDAVFCSGEKEALDKPNIIWSLHFNINEYDSPEGKLPSNVYSCPGPDLFLDFDDHVIKVNKVYFSTRTEIDRA